MMMGNFKKQFALVLCSVSFVMAGSASAGTIPFEKYPTFVEKCAKRGLEKLSFRSADSKFRMIEESFRVNSIDARWYNPSQYVWYEMDAQNTSTGEIIAVTTLVQYYRFDGKCY